MIKNSSGFCCLLLAILILIPLSGVVAQNKATLRGRVTDSSSGEPLPFANVFINELNIGGSTDDRGYFVLTSIPSGRYTINISYVGYSPQTIETVLVNGKMTHVDIDLHRSVYEIGAVEKVGQRFQKQVTTEVSLEKLSLKNLEALPKGVETDVLRSLTLLPGVQSAGDVSAKYYVRGSPSDQNLILLNGAPVYYPFHALGMFSVIDPEVLSSVEFYKGGFTSEYSGRISSVLDMRTKNGNKKQFGITTAGSFLTAKAIVEGPIPYGSFVVQGRVSHSNEILNKFINNNLPIKFYDLTFKLDYANDDFMKNSTLNFFGFFSKDNIRNNNPELEDFNWSNNIIGFNYFQIEEKAPFFAVFLTYFSIANGEVLPNNSDARARENQIKDITAKVDFHYIYDNKDELIFGLQIQGIYTTLILQKSLQDTTAIYNRGNNLSIFAKYKLMQFENLGIDFGSRVNLIRLAGGGHDEIAIEPRLNLLYNFSPEVSFKGAWGLYQQDVVTITDEDELVSLFDPWTITPLYLTPANSIQYVAGLTVDITPNIRFETETYYKLLHDLPIINESRYFVNEPDLVSGSGKAYGWESSLKYEDDNIALTANYSLGYAFKSVNGKTYRPRYDSRHKISLISQINLGDGWSAGLTWNYNSGQNFTQISGYFYRYELADLFGQGVLNNSFYTQMLLGSRNAGRMPDYHRLDVNLSKKFTLGPAKFYIDLNLVNVYDRANVFYFDRETGERINMLPFLPTAVLKMEL